MMEILAEPPRRERRRVSSGLGREVTVRHEPRRFSERQLRRAVDVDVNTLVGNRRDVDPAGPYSEWPGPDPLRHDDIPAPTTQFLNDSFRHLIEIGCEEARRRRR